MIAGGAESSINRLALGGFAAARALSTSYNDEPTRASRPWDKARDGFVMGEGAGALVLESLEFAQARGLRSSRRLSGTGSRAMLTISPHQPRMAAVPLRAMSSALRQAQITPEALDYINAHGTSTPLGDDIELGAVERLFSGYDSTQVSMSSTKSSIGHLLVPRGAVEAVFSPWQYGTRSYLRRSIWKSPVGLIHPLTWFLSKRVNEKSTRF